MYNTLHIRHDAPFSLCGSAHLLLYFESGAHAPPNQYNLTTLSNTPPLPPAHTNSPSPTSTHQPARIWPSLPPFLIPRIYIKSWLRNSRARAHALHTPSARSTLSRHVWRVYTKYLRAKYILYTKCLYINQARAAIRGLVPQPNRINSIIFYTT